MATTGAKAVFLDRDGTLNHDPGYLNDPSQVTLLPGVGEGLKLLQDAGFLLIVISNQSGVARGLVEPSNLTKIEDALRSAVAKFGVVLKAFCYCLHHPKEECECRKPKPKLILDASKEYSVSLNDSYLIGDRESDLAAGRSAGLGHVALVRSGYGRDVEKKLSKDRYDFAGDTFLDVARWIVSD